MRNIVSVVGIIGVVVFIIASILGGLQIEGYSFRSQYISESYATGLPNTDYLRYMYIISGIFMALFGFITPYLLPKSKRIKIGFWLFAIFYGFGTVATGFFPCDIGCNSDPETASISQFIHNTVGFLTYITVPFCLIWIGFSAKQLISGSNFYRISIVCGILALTFVLLLFSNPTGTFVGLFQRILESSILFWIAWTCIVPKDFPKIAA